jgi:hypothetical protein
VEIGKDRLGADVLQPEGLLPPELASKLPLPRLEGHAGRFVQAGELTSGRYGHRVGCLLLRPLFRTEGDTIAQRTESASITSRRSVATPDDCRQPGRIETDSVRELVFIVQILILVFVLV